MLSAGFFRSTRGVLAFDDRFVVGLEVVAEQREAEAALPLERTVAGAAVAAEPAHQRQHVPLEVRDFLSLFGITHRSRRNQFRSRGNQPTRRDQR